MTPNNYKPEIDGLRTLAVMSVIFYHINPSWLPSGFIGVDIFLVISGFLITGIILKANEQQNFSIVEFYARRIKRIIPLTYTLIVVILIAGWFLSYPAFYRAESNSAISALYFLANFRFALLGNYFIALNDSPLLHLWSLSVEEQFYFIWPILIVGLYKLKKQQLLSGLTVGLIVFSMLLAFVFLNNEALQQYAYFLLPTRMTGLLFGALLAIFASKLNSCSNIMATLGTILLGVSIVFIDKNNFPGPSLILPLVGTALIILSPRATFTRNLYANRLAKFIGKISFSLYMWHWPILVFANRYFERHNIDIDANYPLWLSIYFILLFGISTISYLYVETTVRQLKIKTKSVFIYIFVIPLVLLTSICIYISKSNGLPIRYGLEETMTRTETTQCHGSLTKDYCYLNKANDDSSILLIGDSHAGSMNNFVQVMSQSINVTALDASSGGCNFYSTEFKTTQCENAKEKISKVLANKNIETIMVAKRFDKMQEKHVVELMDYIDNLSQRGFKVVLFNQLPKLNNQDYLDTKYMDKYMSGTMAERLDMSKIDSRFQRYNHFIEQRTKGRNIKVIDFTTLMCNESSCRILDENGYPLYYDDDHISAYGAEWLFKQFKQTEQFTELNSYINN